MRSNTPVRLIPHALDFRTIQVSPPRVHLRHIFNWDELIYGSSILLVLTDFAKGDVQPEDVIKSLLLKWICAATEDINYTPKGRAQSAKDPSLAATVNVAFLALQYGKWLEFNNIRGAKSYQCWALSQALYILRDSQQGADPYSLLVGFGDSYPTHVYDRAASCPAPGQGPCTELNKIQGWPDPNVLVGALVHGPASLTDELIEVRADGVVDTLVRLDWNAALPGLLAGVVDAGVTMEGCSAVIESNPVCEMATLRRMV